MNCYLRELNLREAIKQHSFTVRLNSSELVFYRIVKQRFQLLRYLILNINIKYPGYSMSLFLELSLIIKDKNDRK